MPLSNPRSCQPSVYVLLTCHQQGGMLPPAPSSAGLMCTPRALKRIHFPVSRIVSHLPWKGRHLLKLGTLPALPGLCHVPGALELKQTCPHLGCIPSCRPTP